MAHFSMKIKLRSSMAGAGGCYDRGDTIEVTEEVGSELVKRGYAEKLEAQAVILEAAPTIEQAVAKTDSDFYDSKRKHVRRFVKV